MRRLLPPSMVMLALAVVLGLLDGPLKLGLADPARRQRSARLWTEAQQALERGDAEVMMRLARQRSEESAEAAARVLWA